MTDTPMVVGEAKRFGLLEILILNVLCLFLAVPCGVALGVGIAVMVGGVFSGSGLGLAMAALALLLSAGIVFFFPVLMGNPYVWHLTREAAASVPPDAGVSFVVQIATRPRLHDGVRGFLEDADDVGCLSVSATGVTFAGDHVSVRLPAESIVSIRTRNIGWRGAWICGRRIEVVSSLLSDYEYIEFCDRDAVTILGSVRNTCATLLALRTLTGCAA